VCKLGVRFIRVRRKNSSFRDKVRHFILVVFRALNRSRIPVIINRYWKCHLTSNGIVFTAINGKGSKIVHGCYFDRTRKLVSFKLLDKKRSIISVASIIYISPILQCLNGALNLTETTHVLSWIFITKCSYSYIRQMFVYMVYIIIILRNTI
jgi:hypothetical protein